VAILATAKLPVGSSSLTAKYNGDSNNGKSQATMTQQVVQATVSITLASTPNPSQAGNRVKFTASVTSNGGLPKTQRVTFSYNNSSLGTAAITAAGTATFYTKALPAGTDTVTATYAGNTNYSAASGSVSQTVN
jgi:hypothetical protein